MTKNKENRYHFFMKVSYEEAISRILDDQVVALPTETLYGLSAKISSPHTVKKIFDIKRRPLTKPLIVLVPNIPSLLELTIALPEDTLRLAYSFWPGPLTLILPVDTRKIPPIVRAGQPTCAFRIPASEKLLSLLHETGPLVSPSANISDQPPATTPEEIESTFGIDFPVLPAAAPMIGKESTILGFEGDRWWIERAGFIAKEYFLPILGYEPMPLKKNLAYSSKNKL